MNHFIIAAELSVFILEGIQTVRTMCHDLLDAIRVQVLNVLHRHILEQVFVS